jgi:hypothetical protein
MSLRVLNGATIAWPQAMSQAKASLVMNFVSAWREVTVAWNGRRRMDEGIALS